MKAVVAAFNQEKALVGAFSVITNLRMELFEALITTIPRAECLTAHLQHRDEELPQLQGAAPRGDRHVRRQLGHAPLPRPRPARQREHCTVGRVVQSIYLHNIYSIYNIYTIYSIYHIYHLASNCSFQTLLIIQLASHILLPHYIPTIIVLYKLTIHYPYISYTVFISCRKIVDI